MDEFAYSNKPTKRENARILNTGSEDGTYQNISLASCILTYIEWRDEEPFRIPYTKWNM